MSRKARFFVLFFYKIFFITQLLQFSSKKKEIALNLYANDAFCFVEYTFVFHLLDK